MRKEKLLELKRYINELKTIKMERIDTESKFLKTEVYDCSLNNGNTIRRERLIKGNNNGSAVIILPITVENEVLLVVEPRVFTKKSVGVGLPAGYIEYGEKDLDAAFRELKEETGYEATRLINLGGFYQDTGCSSAYNKMFLALGCEKTSNQSLDKDEFVKYFLCKPEEMLELIDLGYIQGGNALLTIEKAKKYILRRN